MKVNAFWTRLYVRPEDGASFNAVVAYKKRPFEQKVVMRGGKRQTVISCYQHQVLLNLWIVHLRFDWKWDVR